MATMIFTSMMTQLGQDAFGPMGRLFTGPVNQLLEPPGAPKHSHHGRRSMEALRPGTYGQAIPRVIGTARLPGILLWADRIQEHAQHHVQQQRSGKQKTPHHHHSYSYSVSCAVAFCLGPIDDFLCLWIDGTPYGWHDFTCRLYHGHDGQLPDPAMEMRLGMGTTPAYPDLAYIFFESFPLTRFGNRMPDVSVEIRCRPRIASAPDVEDRLQGIVMLPGSGEFVYDTVPQDAVHTGHDAFGWESARKIPLNHHSFQHRTNALLSLDQLKRQLPAVTSIAVVVNWFVPAQHGNLSELADPVPGVEYTRGWETQPDHWEVAGITRDRAYAITHEGPPGESRPRYGGTVSDGSLLRYLRHLKAEGYRVILLPMPLIDAPGKPWRGHLRGTPKETVRFLREGYRRFIEHYAKLTRDCVDIFVLGSELKGLTACTDAPGSFPGVEVLCDLAALLRGWLRPETRITYAADWSEYHHTEGGWYHLDSLWAHEAIDAVGLDAYFPLTNPEEEVTYERILAGWTAGEGYDWWRDEDGSKRPLEAPYAWKNMRWWWSHEHRQPDGRVSAWRPCIKPVWWMEFGFPSVDGATHQPNIFSDPACIDGGFPRGSTGMVSFQTQKIAIRASLDFLDQNRDMIGMALLWAWDARPYPVWPGLKSLWSDGPRWQHGHWVNGKLGATTLGHALLSLTREAGLPDRWVDVHQVEGDFHGSWADDIMSYRQWMESWMLAYGLWAVEEEGVLRFFTPRDTAIHRIPAQDWLASEDVSLPTTVTRTTEDLSAKSLDLVFSNPNRAYQWDYVYAGRAGVSPCRVTLPLVLRAEEAEAIAHRLWGTHRQQRVQLTGYLPPSYHHLTVGSWIRPEGLTEGRTLQITAIDRGAHDGLKIQACLMDSTELFPSISVSAPVPSWPDLILPPSHWLCLELPLPHPEYPNAPLWCMVALPGSPDRREGWLHAEQGEVEFPPILVPLCGSMGWTAPLPEVSAYPVGESLSVVCELLPGSTDPLSLRPWPWLGLSLLWVEGEMIAYRSVTPLGGHRYRFEGVVRGLYPAWTPVVPPSRERHRVVLVEAGHCLPGPVWSRPGSETRLWLRVDGWTSEPCLVRSHHTALAPMRPTHGFWDRAAHRLRWSGMSRLIRPGQWTMGIQRRPEIRLRLWVEGELVEDCVIEGFSYSLKESVRGCAFRASVAGWSPLHGESEAFIISSHPQAKP
jgi:hypothetical protein